MLLMMFTSNLEPSYIQSGEYNGAGMYRHRTGTDSAVHFRKGIRARDFGISISAQVYMPLRGTNLYVRSAIPVSLECDSFL